MILHHLPRRPAKFPIRLPTRQRICSRFNLRRPPGKLLVLPLSPAVASSCERQYAREACIGLILTRTWNYFKVLTKERALYANLTTSRQTFY